MLKSHLSFYYVWALLCKIFSEKLRCKIPNAAGYSKYYVTTRPNDKCLYMLLDTTFVSYKYQLYWALTWLSIQCNFVSVFHFIFYKFCSTPDKLPLRLAKQLRHTGNQHSAISLYQYRALISITKISVTVIYAAIKAYFPFRYMRHRIQFYQRPGLTRTRVDW